MVIRRMVGIAKLLACPRCRNADIQRVVFHIRKPTRQDYVNWRVNACPPSASDRYVTFPSEEPWKNISLPVHIKTVVK